jgi:hypothetical protein
MADDRFAVPFLSTQFTSTAITFQEALEYSVENLSDTGNMEEVMRLIKFRVFDNGQMIYPKRIMFRDDGSFMYSAPNIMPEDDWFNGNPEIHPVEQFTGLLDKNGKEIYEGDVIYMCYGKARVFWNETTASWHIKFDTDTDLLWYYTCGKEECHVIGNRHENPELIK